MPLTDLFEEQKEVLPDWYGKKNKRTTEQAFFYCKICECELKSVVTLKAHCKGIQHARKAIQKKIEVRKRSSEGSRDGSRGRTSKCRRSGSKDRRSQGIVREGRLGDVKGIQEVPREGSCKVDRVEEKASTSMAGSEATEKRSVEEAVTRLHWKVRDAVCATLNCYYPHAKQFNGEVKIISEEEYSQLARSFSRRLRHDIKESFELINGSLQGITLTPDNREYINMQMESFFQERNIVTFQN